MKLAEKEKAITLRKTDKSLNYISSVVGVSKSTVSLWVRDLPLSQKAKQAIRKAYTEGQLASQRAIRNRTLKYLALAEKEAETIVEHLNPLISYYVRLSISVRAVRAEMMMYLPSPILILK